MLKIWLLSFGSVGVRLLDSSMHLSCGVRKAAFFQRPPSLLKNYSADEISFPEQFLHEVRQIRIIPVKNLCCALVFIKSGTSSRTLLRIGIHKEWYIQQDFVAHWYS